MDNLLRLHIQNAKDEIPYKEYMLKHWLSTKSLNEVCKKYPFLHFDKNGIVTTSFTVDLNNYKYSLDIGMTLLTEKDFFFVISIMHYFNENEFFIIEELQSEWLIEYEKQISINMRSPLFRMRYKRDESYDDFLREDLFPLNYTSGLKGNFYIISESGNWFFYIDNESDFPFQIFALNKYCPKLPINFQSKASLCEVEDIKQHLPLFWKSIVNRT